MAQRSEAQHTTAHLHITAHQHNTANDLEERRSLVVGMYPLELLKGDALLIILALKVHHLSASEAHSTH